MDKVCCFSDADVRVEQLGNLSAALVVDGFFCPDFLEFIDNFTASVAHHVLDDMSSYPGWRVQFDVREHPSRMKDIKRRLGHVKDAEFLDLLLEGHYLKCVGRAAETAKFTLVPAGTFEAALAQRSAGGLAMVTQRPSPFSNAHVDPGQAVINVHLARGFDDTSTAFFSHAETGQELCVGDAVAMRACKTLIDSHTTFNVIHDHRMSQRMADAPCEDANDDCAAWAYDGRCSREPIHLHRICPVACGVCGGLWLGSHVPAGRDHSGRLLKYHEECAVGS